MTGTDEGSLVPLEVDEGIGTVGDVDDDVEEEEAGNTAAAALDTNFSANDGLLDCFF